MSILDLALVAHDTKKDALIAWAERHRSLLSGHRILAILSDRVQIERDGTASTLNF